MRSLADVPPGAPTVFAEFIEACTAYRAVTIEHVRVWLDETHEHLFTARSAICTDPEGDGCARHWHCIAEAALDVYEENFA